MRGTLDYREDIFGEKSKGELLLIYDLTTVISRVCSSETFES